MNPKTLRTIIFPLHRYLGLIVGILLIIVGLTGSLLVFQHEIDDFLVEQQFGQVIPQAQRLSIESVLEIVKANYADQSDVKLTSITTLPELTRPYQVWIESPTNLSTQVFVNPYTGKILGSQVWDQSLIGITFKLHYELLAGRTGQTIVGIAALLLFILCVTGIALWSGWRKLISGFKIKWKAHPKRTNYDVHKVAGIVTAVFLAMIAFSGFCWNFYEQARPAIHTATFTPLLPDPISQPIAGKAPLAVSDLLAKADAVFPGAVTIFVSLPQAPEEVLRVGKKQAQESSHYGYSRVYLDQYTGKVLQQQDGMQPTRAERVLNAFGPMHFGTFGGLPTRILYVFVGLAPLVLSITGFIMWWYRKRQQKPTQKDDLQLVERS